MLTVGNLLKKARENSGKDIKEIAQILKIKPKYLEAIEQNIFNEFASTTYVKGFIRSYAAFLGLDAESIVALFRRQIGEEEKPLKTKSTISKQNTVLISPTAILSGIVVIFFVGLFGFLIYQFYNLQQPPALSVSSPVTSDSSVNVPNYEIKGATETNTVVTINSSQIQIREDATFSYSVELKEGANTFKIEDWKKNVEAKKAEKIIVINYYPQKAGTAVPTATPGANEPQLTKHKINVSTSAEAWLQVHADNIQQVIGVKKKGYSYNFEVKNSLEITTGKPNSTSVTIDGVAKTWRIKKGIGYISCSSESGSWVCE